MSRSEAVVVIARLDAIDLDLADLRCDAPLHVAASIDAHRDTIREARNELAKLHGIVP